MGYRSTNKTVYAAKYHIIWCPKYRRRVLVGAVEDRLNQLIVEVTGELVRRYVENQKTAA
ncbi:MAG: transposase [Actinobacteria bacterium]|nr:transposase [Actinomycetota bacterium]